LEGGCDGGCPSIRGADDGDSFAFFNVEVDVLEHRRLGALGVGEPDVGECDET